MRNLHFDNSYNIWSPSIMRSMIEEKTTQFTDDKDTRTYLNRPFISLYIEWWLHNIGYYLTKFINKKWAKDINLRCRHVDLEEWKK